MCSYYGLVMSNSFVRFGGWVSSNSFKALYSREGILLWNLSVFFLEKNDAPLVGLVNLVVP